MRWRDVSLILATAVLLVSGAWEVATQDEAWSGAGLMAAGMVVLGFWLGRGDD